MGRISPAVEYLAFCHDSSSVTTRKTALHGEQRTWTFNNNSAARATPTDGRADAPPPCPRARLHPIPQASRDVIIHSYSGGRTNKTGCGGGSTVVGTMELNTGKVTGSRLKRATLGRRLQSRPHVVHVSHPRNPTRVTLAEASTPERGPTAFHLLCCRSVLDLPSRGHLYQLRQLRGHARERSTPSTEGTLGIEKLWTRPRRRGVRGPKITVMECFWNHSPQGKFKGSISGWVYPSSRSGTRVFLANQGADLGVGHGASVHSPTSNPRDPRDPRNPPTESLPVQINDLS